MAQPKVLTGAIALIRVKGQVVGKIKSVRYQENMRRIPIRGLGTILPSEQAVTEWDGSFSCDFFEMKYDTTGIPDAIKRRFTSSRSQVLIGQESFEDQLVLDTEGVQIDIFKKVSDIIDPVTGIIKPALQPYAIITKALIESDSFDISDGNVAGHSQSFKCLEPVIVTP